jgi:hypothetical protein
MSSVCEYYKTCSQYDLLASRCNNSGIDCKKYDEITLAHDKLRSKEETESKLKTLIEQKNIVTTRE